MITNSSSLGATVTKFNSVDDAPTSNILWILLIFLIIIFGTGYYEYSDLMLVVNRSDGRDTLMDVVSRQDLFFKKHHQYATTLEELAYTNVEDFSIPSQKGLYRILITESDGVSYSLAAEAQEEQTGDSKCTPLTYTSKGHVKSSKGSNGSACW